MGIIGANNPDACHTCDGGSNPPGTEFQQNNIAVTISAGYFIKPALGAFSMIDKIVEKLNLQSFTITEIQTPVCVVAFEQQGLVVKRKYKYIFKPGKGKYGLGGTPITAADLEYWVSETFTDIDAKEDPNTIVVDLGDLPTGDYLTAANGAERDFNDVEKRYFVSYTKDGVGYLVMFKGENGYYGGTYPDDFTAEDFVPTYDTTMPPNIVYTSQLINDGANGSDPFTTASELAAVEENAVKKNGSALQTIVGDIIVRGKLFILGVGSILDGSTINAYFKKITSAENIDINTAVPTLPNHAVRKDFAEGLVNGMTLSVNQASAEMYLKNSTGTTLATLNLGFLNNEGTTFFYNETTQKLELKNDAGEILSEVPVSAFVSNLMQSVNFNGATPSILEFKDATGTLVDSVTITINNVAGLQEALNGKANKDGTNATGTWPIHVTGNAGNSLLWNSMPINLSAVSPTTDYLLGNKSGSGVLVDSSGVKIWLAIAITDVSGLTTSLAGLATSLAGKASLAGGNAFAGNQTIYGTVTISDAPQGNSLKLARNGFGALFGNSSTEDGLILYNLAGTAVYQHWHGNGNVTIGSLNDTGEKFQVYGPGKFTGPVTIEGGTALTTNWLTNIVSYNNYNPVTSFGVFNAIEGSLKVRDNIPNAADLNDYDETGIYTQISNIAAASGANYPSPDAGKLEVVRNFNNIEMCYQTYHTYGIGNTIYYRALHNNIWSAWKEVASKADVITSRPYKVYTATMTQTGTAAPEAVVLENTIGDIVWSYNLGRYNGTLPGAFPANKVAFFVTKIENYFDPITNVKIKKINDDTIEISTANASNISTNGILNAVIEIRVYN